MKKLILPVLYLALCTLLSGCGLMEDSFKMGFWIALVIAAIIGLLIWALHFSYTLLARRYPVVRWYVDELLNG